MSLPIHPPFLPMEAQQVDEIPTGPGWQYEPKWDGFRCLAFRSDASIDLQSKSAKPLTRYFPDVAEAMRGIATPQFVIDGEIVVPADDSLSFDALLMRIHPAESRVKKLALETPALFIAFDLLVDVDGVLLTERPIEERRERLERFARTYLNEQADVRLSPCTRAADIAQEWLASARAGLDGIIAKRLGVPYASGQRTAMRKIKKMRTAECVVGGFRYGSRGGQIGSLLLGLYDEDGVLHHVGFTSSFKAGEKPELTRKVEALKGPPGFTGRAPGGPSRWSTERTGQWEPLRPELVAEVQYDHFSEGRFRHGTKFLRWRPDKDPRACTMDQVIRQSQSSLHLLG